MTETTWLQQRVPCDVILGVEDGQECVCPKSWTEGGVSSGNVFADLSADLTWKALKQETVSRQEMPREAMVSVVRRLLA
jgi:hypothetical protein